jgi:hypothetical protein
LKKSLAICVVRMQGTPWSWCQLGIVEALRNAKAVEEGNEGR